MPPDLVHLVALGVVVTLGAVVQSTVGFGLAVVAVPVIAVVDPGLLPTAVLVTGFVLPAVDLLTGPRRVLRGDLGRALAARVVTTPLGVLLVVRLPAAAIEVLVGGLVIAAAVVPPLVTAGRLRWAPETPPAAAVDADRRHRRRVVAAGLLTGVSATTAAVGGPFFALTLRGRSPDELRDTLAAFFVVGAVLSLSALAVGGQVHAHQLRAGMVWIPFVLLGTALARPLRRRIDPDLLRRLVLAFAVLAGTVVIVQAVPG